MQNDIARIRPVPPLFGLALVGALVSVAVCAEPLDEFEVEARASAAASTLGKRLGAKLKAALAQGGPVAGVEVCNEAAGPLTDATSVDLNLSVARTALKYRNPNNAPDPWEKEQLLEFEAALRAGAAPQTLSALKRETGPDGHGQWRYMKPIMTGGVCLSCHGAELDPFVAEVIAERYPNDSATGFALGDLRGAFTVTISE